MAPAIRTLALIKPPCSNMTAVAIRIAMTYVASGLSIVSIKDVVMEKLFFEFYGQHQGKPYFGIMERAYRGKDFTALCLEGDEAVSRVRTINGHTDPRKAAEGTLRRRFGDLEPRTDGLTTPFNAVHGSDSDESAYREIELVFPLLQ